MSCFLTRDWVKCVKGATLFFGVIYLEHAIVICFFISLYIEQYYYGRR